IRKNVKFHEGQALIPEDVAYTFKRGILEGGQATGIGMLCQNLLGEASYAKLDQIATVKGDSVTFKLPKPFVPFLGVMADSGSEAAIFSKSWCVAQGDWPGTKETGQKFMGRKMEEDVLMKKMNGTGPFKLAQSNLAERVVLEANKAYWAGAPKLERVIRRIVPDNQTAILQLKAGD